MKKREKGHLYLLMSVVVGDNNVAKIGNSSEKKKCEDMVTDGGRRKDEDNKKIQRILVGDRPVVPIELWLLRRCWLRRRQVVLEAVK